jgi:chemotaxis protein methyltransferase CheR
LALPVIVDRPARVGERGVAVEDIEVQLLLEGLVQRSGYDFRGYDPPVVKRRIERALATESLSTISELQSRALHDDACLSRVIHTLTFREVSFFGDAQLFRDLRSAVFPLLRTYPFVRIWSAGCSTGEDTYALAIALEEAGLYGRCRIYATDAARSLVEVAQSRAYPADRGFEWQRAYAAAGGDRTLDDYVSIDGPHAMIDAQLGRNIVFAQHSVVVDGSFNQFHLIFCPGMMRQFNKDLQSQAHGTLYGSLVRLGFLGLATDESVITSPFARAYRRSDVEASIHRRIL